MFKCSSGFNILWGDEASDPERFAVPRRAWPGVTEAPEGTILVAQILCRSGGSGLPQGLPSCTPPGAAWDMMSLRTLTPQGAHSMASWANSTTVSVSLSELLPLNTEHFTPSFDQLLWICRNCYLCLNIWHIGRQLNRKKVHDFQSTFHT